MGKCRAILLISLSNEATIVTKKVPCRSIYDYLLWYFVDSCRSSFRPGFGILSLPEGNGLSVGRDGCPR